MNKTEDIKAILKIDENEYRHGVAGAYVDFKTMKKLHAADLLEMEYSRKDGPKIREFYDFMEKHKDKKISVRLAVMEPKREDFRIYIQVLSIDPEYAKLKTEEDMEFWREFMVFGTKGNACMAENVNSVSWCWYN